MVRIGQVLIACKLLALEVIPFNALSFTLMIRGVALTVGQMCVLPVDTLIVYL